MRTASASIHDLKLPITSSVLCQRLLLLLLQSHNGFDDRYWIDQKNPDFAEGPMVSSTTGATRSIDVMETTYATVRRGKFALEESTFSTSSMRGCLIPASRSWAKSSRTTASQVSPPWTFW